MVPKSKNPIIKIFFFFWRRGISGDFGFQWMNLKSFIMWVRGRETNASEKLIVGVNGCEGG